MDNYITIKELQQITGATYNVCRKIILETNEESKRLGFYVLPTKEKRALRWMVEKKLGVKNEKKN